MYNMEDILVRLQNGEKDTDIANEMAQALNAAVSAYDAGQKKDKRKAEIMDQITNLMREYTAVDYPELAKEFDVSSSEMVELLDATLKEMINILNMMNINIQEEREKENKPAEGCGRGVTATACPKSKKNVSITTDLADVDKALKSFLELFNL